MFTFVTGTGYTGRRLLRMLPADEAAGLSRSRRNTDRPHFVFDLDTATSLPVNLPDDYAIVYTVPPAGNPDHRLERFLPLLDPTPRRFVYISTTGVYGDCRGKSVTEATPVNPSNERSARRVAAEKLLEDWARGTNCRLVVLRAPGIYGPGRLGVAQLEAGMPVLNEQSANPGNRIHVDDLVRCCIAALSPAVPAGIYNVGDGDHRSSHWFSNEVARQRGLPPPPEVTMDEARQQFSPQRLSFVTESRVVDTTKMRDVLGVTPRYANPEDGIRDSVGAPLGGDPFAA
ncbi:MAG: NAD-dependent epimerase/dehydratase family protein [Gammaproteobacteria bacterium]|nr:NAD-dependent epimerase/dehydratase family protein [Gammaproteobacteria bacterium]